MSHIQYVLQLDTLGNGTGTFNAIGDYSTIGEHFHKTNSDFGIMAVQRITVYLKTAGNLSSDKYGDSLDLINGIHAYYIAHGKTYELTENAPIINNGDWAKNGGLLQELSFAGGTKKAIAYNWILPNGGIEVRKGEKFSIFLNDNFTGLIEHYFRITGYFDN